MDVCARRAKELGLDLEDVVWAVTRALIAKAARGDVQAARVLLDRLLGPVVGPAMVEVNVDARQNPGPPVPPDGRFADYLADLARAVDEVRFAARLRSEVEDLLG